jgi:hypothetical protein
MISTRKQTESLNSTLKPQFDIDGVPATRKPIGTVRVSFAHSMSPNSSRELPVHLVKSIWLIGKDDAWQSAT